MTMSRIQARPGSQPPGMYPVGPEPERPARRTRTELLRLEVADDIASGRLPPGARLDEAELAARFGVSRTPVREALRELAAMGLVEARPHRGVIVTRLDDARLATLFEAMAELEAVCARLAARAMSARERRALEALHEECAQAMRDGAEDVYNEANLRFHAAIYEGSHNRFLADSTLGVRRRVEPFRRAQFRNVGRLARSFEEHDRILTAILRGDGDGAAQAMRAHIGTVQDAFAAYFARTAPARHRLGGDIF